MGIIRSPQVALVTMLSKCTALQYWQGNTFSQAQLLARIYEEQLPTPANGVTYTLDELRELRPFILVGADANSPVNITREGGGGEPWWKSNGILNVMFEIDAIGSDEAAIDRNFTETIEQALYTGNHAQPGVLDQCDTEGAVQIKSVAVAGPYRSMPKDREEFGDALRYHWVVRWGLD